MQPDSTPPGAPGGGRTVQVADWRHDPQFRWPERAPWSELEEAFLHVWAFDPPRAKREHMEVIGPSGSGKTHLVQTILQGHYRVAERRRQAEGRKHLETGGIFVATKTDDDVFRELGWPITGSAQQIQDTNVIFWPRTRRLGQERTDFHDKRVLDLLHRLWQPKANTVLAFDEVGYLEGLSGELRRVVQQYWREARSMGIQIIGMKQRPQGALRDMHSETYWTVAFNPNDRADLERFAELFGHPRDWMPVLNTVDPDRHEFLIRHSRSREAYISWVDVPLQPQRIRKRHGVHALVAQ